MHAVTHVCVPLYTCALITYHRVVVGRVAVVFVVRSPAPRLSAERDWALGQGIAPSSIERDVCVRIYAACVVVYCVISEFVGHGRRGGGAVP